VTIGFDVMRFCLDDIHYGLVIAKWLAQELKLGCPTVDEVLEWAQKGCISFDFVVKHLCLLTQFVLKKRGEKHSWRIGGFLLAQRTS